MRNEKCFSGIYPIAYITFSKLSFSLMKHSMIYSFLQETHEELAERTGKYVVEYRPEQGNRPVVVAVPSERSLLRRISKEEEGKEEDITKYFDPYRGAHKPKTLDQIQGTHQHVLADIQLPEMILRKNWNRQRHKRQTLEFTLVSESPAKCIFGLQSREAADLDPVFCTLSEELFLYFLELVHISK